MGKNSKIYFQIFLLFNALLFFIFQSFQGFIAYRTKEVLDNFQLEQAKRGSLEALNLMQHSLFQEAFYEPKESLARNWFLKEVNRIEKTYYLKGIWFQNPKGEFLATDSQKLDLKDALFQSDSLIAEGLYGFKDDLGNALVIGFSLELPQLFSVQEQLQRIGVFVIGFLFLLVMLAVRILFLRTEKLQDKLSENLRLVEFGRLASGVAHDIRNPLSSMSLQLQELKELHSNDLETNTYLKNITKEISRVQHTLSTLMVFEKENIDLSQKIELISLIDEVLEIFSENQSKLSFLKPNFKIMLKGNKDLLFRMLENAFRNALEVEAVDLRVSINVELDDKFALICVSDNGNSFLEFEKAISPFFTTKNYGTGLGLVVIKDAVERHFGKIIVKANKPSGTILKLCIPFDSKTKII